VKRYALLVSIMLSFGVATPASGMESIVESVAKGCEGELSGFCGQVTPGKGRLLACLYAHEDKLSGQCELALYDAAAQLERFIGALTYVANECDEDLEAHCAMVAAGEGRLAQCLLDNKSKLQPRCVTAIEDTGMAIE